MTLTLLIDLDDTLLSNPMESFIPAYMKALGKHYAAYASNRKLGSVMNKAIEMMLTNHSPDRSLKDVFDGYFYPNLGITEENVKEHNEYFYREEFPNLQSVTQTRPEAIELIETAFKRGWQVAIATNPFFPYEAISHRLIWAGVPPEKYPYAIIPSYETFHFGKPNPAYFAELLGRVGWPRGSILMVGNDPENDIQAAKSLGIPCFWISNSQPYPEDFIAPNSMGTLEDIIPWVDSVPNEDLLPDYSSESAISGTMQGIPAALLSMTADLPREVWQEHPGVDEWGLTEIACHLRDVEREINLLRLQKIVREDNPFIPGVDSDVWATERNYRSQNGPEALNDFVSARVETLEILKNLSQDDWQRPVQHAIFGPTNLKEIASFIAGHDRLHIRQSYALLI